MASFPEMKKEKYYHLFRMFACILDCVSVDWGGGDTNRVPLIMSNNLSVKSHTSRWLSKTSSVFHIVIFFSIFLEVVFLWWHHNSQDWFPKALQRMLHNLYCFFGIFLCCVLLNYSAENIHYFSLASHLSKESVKNILVVMHEVKENEILKYRLFMQFAAVDMK
jgi:hypothetical protein